MSTFGVLQAVALALRLQDMATVGKSIQSRSRQPFAAEDLGPVLKRQIGGHDQAIALVSRGDHVEQQFRAGFARGNVTEFVEDQHVQLAKLLP